MAIVKKVIKKAQNGEYVTKEGSNYTSTRKTSTTKGPRYYQAASPNLSFARERSSDKMRKVNDSIPKANLSKGALERLNQKNGGKNIKKAQTGDSIKPVLSPYMQKRAAQQIVKEKNIRLRDSVLNRQAAAQGRTREEMRSFQSSQKNKSDADVYDGQSKGFGKKQSGCSGSESANKKRREDEQNRRNGGPITKVPNGPLIKKNGSSLKNGGMLKRKDGSISKRGLYDNIRANKGSGKNPTAAMLKQERKIKAKK